MISYNTGLVQYIAALSHSAFLELESSNRSQTAILQDELELLLRTVHIEDDETLVAVLRTTYKVQANLPSWQPLLNSVKGIFISRHGHQRTNQLLFDLNSPNRDTIEKNTGQLVYKR